jgi:hypothetical protein
MSYLAALLPILISSLPLFGADPDPMLLPTTGVAQQVRELQAKLADANDREREMYFNQMTTKLTDFVVAQLEAEPRLDRWQMREQLIRARGAVPPERSHYHDGQPPYVFRLPPSSGPSDAGPIVWSVVYRDTLYHGMGGSRILVESYVVENGKARLAGRGGSEMSGYDLNADEIPNPSSNSVSVLIHGILEWSNGHQFPGKAILYDVGPAGVQTAWQTPMLLGLTAHPDPTGFTVIYHDEERHQAAGLRDASVTETYSAGPQGLVLIGTQQN